MIPRSFISLTVLALACTAAITAEAGHIAVVDTGDVVVDTYVARLSGLGHDVTAIPAESGFDVLVGYSLVVLPVGHGDLHNGETFLARAADYHLYVETGGGLWVGQPNPWTLLITWVPYYLYLDRFNTDEDCPPVVVDPEHCLTAGLPDDEFPFPGDTVIHLGDEWHVLVAGSTTGNPALLFAEFGSGKILVELGHPGATAICRPSDAVLARFVACIASDVVAVDQVSWTAVRARFR